MKRLLIIYLVFNISSCHFTAPEFRKIENFNVNQISPNKVLVNASVRFHNPNKNNLIKINSIQLDALSNDKLIGRVSNNNLLKPVYKDKDILIPFDLEVNPMNLVLNFNNLLDLISRKTLVINLNGYAETKLFIFKKRIKINHSESINLENLPLNR